MKEITMKVVSYCEIPEEITQYSWLQELPCNVYTDYSLPTQEELDNNIYSLDYLSRWLIQTYPELIGTKFLIEMDY